MSGIAETDKELNFIDLEFPSGSPIIGPMKAGLAEPNVSIPATPGKMRLPLWLKLAYTGFMTVLVPVYLRNYGPTNFLYCCDASLYLPTHVLLKKIGQNEPKAQFAKASSVFS